MSPKEKRRSTRRSGTSKSSGSPSPDAASLPPNAHQHDANSSARSAASSSSNSTTARGKRAKDDSDEFHPAPPTSHRRTTSVTSTANGAHPHSSNAVSSTQSTNNKRTKRKTKEHTHQPEEHQPSPVPEEVLQDGEEGQGEETGITRCFCVLIDEEAENAEFMLQCETCMTWQHGPCMGFLLESEAPEGDYYCEQCRPQDHPEIIKKLRRQRQSSEKSMHAAASRVSRSHSPTTFMKTTKRRNTLNSREAAAYEESFKELLEASALEAMPNGDAPAPKDRATSVASKQEEPTIEETIEVVPTPTTKKKRKRADDEVSMAKRKRSASVVSEQVVTSVTTAVEKAEVTSPITVNTTILPPPTPVPANKRTKRGGGRKNAKDTPTSATAPVLQEVSVNGDVDESAATTKKHPNQYTYRAKAGGGQSRRAPQSASGPNQQNATTHEHGTRRNNANNAANNAAGGLGGRQGHNAYYNNMQLPMFTSWGLPDYLAHLQSILPSEVPSPLELRGAMSFLVPPSLTGTNSTTSKDDSGEELTNKPSTNGEANEASEETSNVLTDSNMKVVEEVDMATAYPNATESVTERGVKVKWPAKRMSVSDMNKRVRALVEWVGREQALQAERERRKEALKSAVSVNLQEGMKEAKERSEIGKEAEPTADIERILATMGFNPGPTTTTPSTSKMMEELMEELISFQERFGPGAKQGKDRRVAVLA
ncbi:histone deacetylase complex subunit cti6 [Pyrrhoderma noxium]|uniref:Histone deacetylase complex subunit cti6 n=1 Tax=Pyrrhoderma noxium TaxID=2282107 RepID=A0A286UGI3_9AGAM|nr:histone deacetylase complex subunit cti6 [Pyrrhoderma noxium]